MGIRNHDKKDPRYSDEKIKITHKGLLSKINKRKEKDIIKIEIDEEINLYQESKNNTR